MLCPLRLPTQSPDLGAAGCCFRRLRHAGCCYGLNWAYLSAVHVLPALQFAEVKVIATKSAKYFFQDENLPPACRPVLGGWVGG